MDKTKLILYDINAFLNLFTVSDWISIANILVTAVIGIWIVNAFQKNLTKERFEKEHFINEVKDIRDHYKMFINKLYICKKSSNSIKEWFKIMSNKTKTLENILNNRYDLGSLELHSKHAEIQQKVTYMSEFNDCYKKDRVIFEESSKNEILRLHGELSNIITDVIIKINSAKKARK